MKFLTRLFPAACSRLRIFICYAREDRDLAVDIGHALTNDGHDVFIDANSLRVATDFNEEIRNAIGRADRFVFLVSRHSLDRQAYPQTELGFAEKRWPAPKGAVWPVLVDPTIDPGQLPPYLRSVQVHTPKGNVVADLAAEIEASRTVRASCLAGLAAAVLAAIGAGALLWSGGPASYALLPPKQVVLMPQKKPGKDDAWMTSPLALTLIPVSYSNDGRRDVRILSETVEVPLGDRTVSLAAFNKVDMRPKCPDWLCYKEGIGVDTLKARDTLRREIMFVPAAGEALDWRSFVTFACTLPDDTLSVTLTSKASSSAALGVATEARQASCKIDLKAVRASLAAFDCKGAGGPLPTKLAYDCLP